MIDEAARAGADVVKFQSYSGSEVRDTDPEKEWFSKVQLPDAVHFELRDHSRKRGVEFLSAPFSFARARFLVEELSLRRVKVASSEMLNFGILDYLNGRVDSIFLSTGMATLDEIRLAVSHLDRVPNVCLMQCTTQYPCPPEQANLSVLPALRQAFPGFQIGYSDHTVGTLAPALARALGAEVIEKHFTTDKGLPGTDHVLSADPAEMAQLVRDVRATEALLGSSEKHPTPAEQAIKEMVRARFPKRGAQ
jgi:N,N'-diacetyllegionaminate synthase